MRSYERKKRWVFALTITFAFLLFFRAGRAFDHLFFPGQDEPCYLAWLHQLIGLSSQKCAGGDFFPGIALTWIPAGLLGRLFGLFFSNTEAWITTFVGITSFLCWGLSLFLLDDVVSEYRKNLPSRLKDSSLLPILLLLSVPILYYCTSRTAWTHAGEIALTLLALRSVLRNQWWGALLWSSWLVATRLNDLPVLLVLLGRMRDTTRLGTWRGKNGFLVGAVFAVLAVALTVALRTAFLSGYNGLFLGQILSYVSWERLRLVLFGSDWGLVGTGPLWLTAAALGLASFFRLSWLGRACFFWMAVNFILCVGWRGNGTDFAYRYLIGSYGAALVLWLECLGTVGRGKGALSFIPYVAGTWMTLLTWFYRNWDLFPHYSPPGIIAQLPRFQEKVLWLSLNPITLLRPLKLSPAFTAFCSWGKSLPACAGVLRGYKNGLEGPPLWVLSALLPLAVIAAFFLVGRIRSEGDLTKEASS